MVEIRVSGDSADLIFDEADFEKRCPKETGECAWVIGWSKDGSPILTRDPERACRALCGEGCHEG